jgi:hypothetical protein
MNKSQYMFNGDRVFGPWMPRIDDNLIITAEVGALEGLGTAFAIQIYHKNSEEIGEGTAMPTPLIVSSVGRSRLEYLDVKEYIRYRFLVNEEDDAGRVLFRMLGITWFAALDANT